MSTATTDFRTDLIGEWREPTEFTAGRARIVQYAEATNDELPQHRSGELAPPVFGVVVAFDALMPCMAEAIPPDLLAMGVHGEQDFRFYGPILPERTLSTRAALAGIEPRSSGVTVTVKAQTCDEDGSLVVEQRMTSFVRGAQTERSGGETTSPYTPSGGRVASRSPVAEVTQKFDEDQTFRYSEASNDRVPIHLDDEIARAVGLPGIIIHGLCTMAFASSAVIKATCAEDPTRLRRLAVRFSRPCLPGQEITTRIFDQSGGEFAFETSNNDGALVLKSGLAVIGG